VASSEVTPRPIADNDNPQEPTPPTPAIGSNHEQFAEGDRVVVAEVGNSHHGKTGKIIAARSRSKDDKYIIALDRKSPSSPRTHYQDSEGVQTHLSDEAVAVGGIRSL
jgi:hypothetical protein